MGFKILVFACQQQKGVPPMGGAGSGGWGKEWSWFDGWSLRLTFLYVWGEGARRR